MAADEAAKLLIIEKLILPGNNPGAAKIMDIAMLIATGGQERSEAAYGSLLEQAGFRMRRVIPTACPASIIEAVPG